MLPQSYLDLLRQSDLGLLPQTDLGLLPQSDLGLLPQSDLGLLPQSDLGLLPESDLDLHCLLRPVCLKRSPSRIMLGQPEDLWLHCFLRLFTYEMEFVPYSAVLENCFAHGLGQLTGDIKHEVRTVHFRSKVIFAPP